MTGESTSQRGKYVRTPETLAKMSAAQRGKRPWLGKKHTPETRAKIAEGNRRAKKDRLSDGYWAIHRWMRRNHPKTGICEECGKVAGRIAHDFACPGHIYTRNRADWKELCRSCHKKLDAALARAA